MVERTFISFSSQLQLIERLQHLLYLSSSMVFISGEKGSGKSTLVEQLSNQLPSNTQQAFITLSEATSAAQIRQLIISQLFERPLFDADDTLANILLLLKENQDPNVARIIVIDNAKLLPAEFISELADVIKQKSSLSDNEINFILLSEESTNKQMVNTIKGSQDNQGVATLTFKLAPLNAQEANQLINHRFAQIGYSPEIQHKDALAKQLANCNGIPEKILLLATELSSGNLAFDNPSWLKTRLPAILLMLLLVAIAGSLATHLYPQFVKDRVEAEIIVETQDDLLEEIVGVGLIAEELSEAMPSEALAGNWSTDDEQVVDDTQLSVGEADKQDRIIISEQQLLELVATEEKNQAAADPIVDILEKESALATEENAPAVVAKENVVEPLPEASEEVVEKLPTVTVDPALQPKALVEPPITEIEPVTRPVDELITSDIDVVHEVFVLQELDVTATAQAEKIKRVKETLAIEEEYNHIFTPASTLLAINKNRFTVQLTGMSSAKSLQEFIRKHQLPRENVYLYKTLRNNKPWYVVIYGQFESRNIANNAVNNLSGTLSNLARWTKDYASVHRDLRLNDQ